MSQLIQKLCLPSIMVLSLAAAACDPKVDTRGHMREESGIAGKITPGVSGREDVLAALGSPSSRTAFGNETWYYITLRREAVAFLAPEVVDQQVDAVVFNEAGVVDRVESYDAKDKKDIDIVSRETPTEGHSLGFIEQILGNIGRYNKSAGDAAAARGR